VGAGASYRIVGRETGSATFATAAGSTALVTYATDAFLAARHRIVGLDPYVVDPYGFGTGYEIGTSTSAYVRASTASPTGRKGETAGSPTILWAPSFLSRLCIFRILCY
jgi:hypothetical protein